MWRFGRSYRKGDYLYVNVKQSRNAGAFGFVVILALVLTVSITMMVH